MLKSKLGVLPFALLISLVNLLFFHQAFYAFVLENLDMQHFSGMILLSSLIVLMLLLNAFIIYLLFSISSYLGKSMLVLFFLINALAIYFVNTFHVILDESMIGNVLNTNYAESSAFFSFKLVLYFLFLGILPSIYIIRIEVVRASWKKFASTTSLSLLFIGLFIFANASNWLWIDKHSKTLGGLAMPWSYTVNLCRFYTHQYQENKQEILLPDAQIADHEKAVMVLVIGESARRANFSLYGYAKNTNPFLSKTANLHHFDALSSATYTTAGVKALLEDHESNDLYEILPNYLYRNGVDVFWRTSNWGEPPVHIPSYKKNEELAKECQGEGCAYDEVLLQGLREQILASDKDKILVVLHTSTSHGPNYNTRYPPAFRTFQPVCNSVELSKCSPEELMNAYDNTIVYTDYILHKLIEELKGLNGYKSSMLFVSDHGESLGEDNLYMHGLPMSIAPKVQYDIPFIVWTSDSTQRLKPNKLLSQQHVFHSVLKFLHLQSPVYNESMNIFE